MQMGTDHAVFLEVLLHANYVGVVQFAQYVYLLEHLLPGNNTQHPECTARCRTHA